MDHWQYYGLEVPDNVWNLWGTLLVWHWYHYYLSINVFVLCMLGAPAVMLVGIVLVAISGLVRRCSFDPCS